MFNTSKCGLLAALCAALLLSGCGAEQNERVTESGSDNRLEFIASNLDGSESVTDDGGSEDNSLEVHMIEVILNSEIDGLDIEGKVMTLGNVEVHGCPNVSTPVNRTLSYEMVIVRAVVRSGEYPGDDRWALVSYFCFDSAYDNIGWVKLTELEQYSAVNAELLRYPVTLAEGCVDLDTGEAVSWDAVSVRYEEDCAVVEWEGGNYHRVDKEYIIYPEP